MGVKLSFLILLIFTSSGVLARDTFEISDRILGASTNEKFTYHRPSYFIAGDDDLKLQFSFKYRLSKSKNLYFGYTQLMFWSIYGKSKPFKDVNYNPELFYRLMEKKNNFLSSLDFGYLHTSNGKDQEDSRSLDRLFLRTNFSTKIDDHVFIGVFKIQKIFNEDATNKDIVNHLGYWELQAVLSEIMTVEGQDVDLHFRTYAGSKLYDFDKGGLEIGLVYNFFASDFNPSLYVQRFEGYSESLIAYNKKRTEYRIGIMLSF